MTATVQPRRRPRWWLEAIGEIVAMVLLKPLREGRLHPRGWPIGLGAISLVAATGYLLAGGLVLMAQPLRSATTLVPASTAFVPEPVLAPLLFVVLLALGLLTTAALHAHPAAAVVAVVVSSSVVLQVNAFSLGIDHPIALLFVIGWPLTLVLTMLLRRRGRFHWWEFVVVQILLTVAICFPLTVSSTTSRSYGYDLRGVHLAGILQGVGQLAIPVLMISGVAFAEVAVRTAGAVGAAARENAPRGLLRVLVPLVVVGALAALTPTLLADPEPVLRSAVLVLASLALAFLLLRGTPDAREDTGPAGLADRWPGLALGPVLVLASFALPSFVVVTASAAAQSGGFAVAALPLLVLAQLVSSSWVVTAMRLVLAVVGLVLARRWARGRGERVRPLLLICLAVVLLPGVLSQVSFQRIRLGWTVDGLVVALAIIAAIGLVALALLKRLDGRRASALVFVLLAATAHRYRTVIADPLTVLLGFSAVAVILFGLLWRVTTEATYTTGDSRAFPLPSRVLFFWATALLAVAALAWLSLSRDTGGNLDVSMFGDLGDFLLGSTLLLAVSVAALRSLLPRSEPGGHLLRSTYQSGPRPGVRS